MTCYACPSCGEKTIGFWTRQTLGPFKSTKCSNCGARLGLSSARAILFLILGPASSFGAGALALGLVVPASGSVVVVSFIAGSIVGAALTILVSDFFVPFVVRDCDEKTAR